MLRGCVKGISKRFSLVLPMLLSLFALVAPPTLYVAYLFSGVIPGDHLSHGITHPR